MLHRSVCTLRVPAWSLKSFAGSFGFIFFWHILTYSSAFAVVSMLSISTLGASVGPLDLSAWLPVPPAAHPCHFSAVRRIRSVRLDPRSTCLAHRHIHLVSRTIHTSCTPTRTSKTYLQYGTSDLIDTITSISDLFNVFMGSVPWPGSLSVPANYWQHSPGKFWATISISSTLARTALAAIPTLHR